MVTLLRGLLIGYVITWAVLLIACLRKRQFCPVFSDPRRTRLFWLGALVLVNPLLTALYLVFGQLRSPQARPVRAVRDIAVVIAIAGFFINVPGLTHLWMQPFLGRSPRAGETAQAHLAAIEAASNTSTTSSTSSSDNSRLACRRLVVIVEGDHPLLHRVGSDLVKQLQEVPAVETVEFQPGGALSEGGRRAPDLFVRLYLASVEETPVPYSLKLTVQIGADVGRMPLRSTHSYHDTFMPPLLDFNLRIEMSHRSTTTGYESVRYTMAARNIAKDLGAQISKALGQWQDKYGLLPELPDRFYGAYVASELPVPFQKLEPVLLGSYTGLLTHNQTYAQFTLTDEPVRTIEELRDAMAVLGWEEMSSDWKLPHLDLRMEKDLRRLHVFQIRPREPFSGQVMIVRASEEQQTFVFGVAAEQRFSRDELNAVLDSLLTEPVSMERLVLFERMFDQQQRGRWLETLENQPPRDVFTQIRLAEMYHGKDLPEEARQALSRARALLWAVRDDSTYKGRLKSLAKKLGDEKLAETTPARQDFLDAGFVELVLDAEAVEMETELNVPSVAFFENAQPEFCTFSVTVVPSGDERNPFSVKHVMRMAHGSSSGSRGGDGRQPDGRWRCALTTAFNDITAACLITQIGKEDRFKLSVTVTQD